MAQLALRQRAAALHLTNPDLWVVRISIAGGRWFQLVQPRVQHLVHSSMLPTEEEPPRGSRPIPHLYHEKAIREGFATEAHYWLHLAHDQASAVEMVFDLPQEALHEDCADPLRWRVGSPHPCVVQLVMRLPTAAGAQHPFDDTVLMTFEYSMDFAAYPNGDKPHHYSMALLASDHTAEMEFHSRMDTETRSGFFYYPTQFSLQIRTDVLPFVMASHNRWFKSYMQGLGVLPEGP